MRKEVSVFAEAMERKLQKNDDKGGWKNCEVEYLKNRMIEEVHEFLVEYEKYTIRTRMFHENLSSYNGIIRTQDECTDVANFCMMIYDILEVKKQYEIRRKN